MVLKHYYHVTYLNNKVYKAASDAKIEDEDGYEDDVDYFSNQVLIRKNMSY